VKKEESKSEKRVENDRDRHEGGLKNGVRERSRKIVAPPPLLFNISIVACERRRKPFLCS